MNNRKVLQGRSNYPLNEVGIAQAQKAAEELKHIAFTKVYTSPLKRAIQTAEIIAPYADAVIDERLIEMVEKPEPEPRTCSLPVKFMRPAELRRYYEEQSADPYYKIIVDERKNLILRKDFTR